MSKQTWVHWVVAAILVLAVGAIIASAEERIEVRVEKNSSDEISVDVNGVTEVVRLDDLADGESRTFDVGDHELVVTRVGDELTITSDGHAFGSFGGHGKFLDNLVWFSEDGEEIHIDGDGNHEMMQKIIIMKSDDEVDGGTRTYTIHIDGDEVMLDGDHIVELDEIEKLHGGGHHGAVFISADGDVDHPMIVRSHGMHSGLVKYLCKETGSILMVKEEDAIEDAYICPATGCVMNRIEEPEVHVIKIQKVVEAE